MEPQEVNKLIRDSQLSTAFSSERFKIMISWQYYGGMRLSELCGLKIENLNYKGRKNFFEEGRDVLHLT